MSPRLLRLVFLILALANVGDVAAGGLIVVDAAKLDKYWRMEPEVSWMEVGGVRDTAYGCIAIGFVIDREGRLTAVRPLRVAFGKDVRPRHARDFGVAISRGSSALPPYKVGVENPNRAEVFTALTIPVFGRGLSKRMDDAQRKAAAERLRPSCEISDLAAWVDSHDMRKEPSIEDAPALDFAPTAGARAIESIVPR